MHIPKYISQNDNILIITCAVKSTVLQGPLKLMGLTRYVFPCGTRKIESELLVHAAFQAAKKA